MGHPVYVLLTGSNNQFQNFEVANAFVLVLDTIQKSKDDIYINTGFNHQFRNYEQTYLALQIWFGNYKITNAFIILVLILKSFEFIVELITNLPIFRCRKRIFWKKSIQKVPEVKKLNRIKMQQYVPWLAPDQSGRG